MENINKRTEIAFNKKIYLLGIDKDECYVWLETPSWDCGWYWGFGYIERYTNNKNPQNAKDISSHSHFNSELVGKQEQGYCYHINDENSIFKATTLTDKESWELSELMQSFYTLKKTAEFFKNGKSNTSETSLNFKDDLIYNMINKEILPEIFKRIDEILSPKELKNEKIL